MSIHILYFNSDKLSVFSSKKKCFLSYEFSRDEYPCDVVSSRPQALCFP